MTGVPAWTLRAHVTGSPTRSVASCRCGIVRNGKPGAYSLRIRVRGTRTIPACDTKASSRQGRV
eukprot:scaffold59629_cov17-Prasinocladus_malaysianus.AAC.1